MGHDHASLPIVDVDPKKELGAAFGAPTDESVELGLDDAGLIREYLGGNPAAYGELVRRHQIPLFRLLLGLLADEDVAEEACEAVFVAAERRLPELADPAGFYHWLLGIAREVSKKYNDRSAFAETVAPAGTEPRDRLKHEIHAVLQQLAPDLRLVLVLVELRGAPEEDVAAALGCPREEVPGLVAEARREFTRILDARARASNAAETRASQHPPRLGVGAVIGERYRVKRALAAGGMGAVYVAERLDGGPDVALKTMLPVLVRDEVSRRRFDREIEAIQRIAHEDFVRVVDHGRSGDLPYLVMELLEGKALGDVADDHEALDPARALRLTRGVLHGLAHAHGVGVVHRDLKPGNIFVVDPDGPGERIKILDLGLAKFILDDEAEEHTKLTEQGAVFGTPAYMAPEQALGEEVDHRADLYAVAVILFQLLTGRPPFESSNAAALLVMHVSSPPPALGERAPYLAGSELEDLVARGLCTHRDGRFASAAEFMAAVDRLLKTKLPVRGDARGPSASQVLTVRESTAPKPAPAATPAPAPARSLRGWAIALVVLALVGGLAAAALVGGG